MAIHATSLLNFLGNSFTGEDDEFKAIMPWDIYPSLKPEEKKEKKEEPPSGAATLYALFKGQKQFNREKERLAKLKAVQERIKAGKDGKAEETGVVSS